MLQTAFIVKILYYLLHNNDFIATLEHKRLCSKIIKYTSISPKNLYFFLTQKINAILQSYFYCITFRASQIFIIDTKNSVPVTSQESVRMHPRSFTCRLKSGGLVTNPIGSYISVCVNSRHTRICPLIILAYVVNRWKIVDAIFDIISTNQKPVNFFFLKLRVWITFSIKFGRVWWFGVSMFSYPIFLAYDLLD